jgi:hypothetical protein
MDARLIFHLMAVAKLFFLVIRAALNSDRISYIDFGSVANESQYSLFAIPKSFQSWADRCDLQRVCVL